GNIRQLRNVTRQLVIGSRGQPQLRLDSQFEQELSSPPASRPEVVTPPPTPPPAPEVKRRKPSDISSEELLAALRECEWDLKPTADQLGIPRPSIYDLIERHPNIRIAGKLSAEEITRCYQECQGDVDAMSRRLEVSKKALQRRVKELGLGAKGG
ncbi:MAG TPA: sigma-54-dependent Fis family transcriptional regulator, partial [Hyalangium sp.]|nr:sigma-54-dependent Fis family transcriptional regulator [Hyalangium sp.]